ncbi:MAG: master DNA invertase Mpi family serine-type recombinase [Bacteroidales bacterium]|jgi:DNA invertase Pin-like site-specific DNA recombinase|nr:master DNA invertase Mpi family serine-type recombinase [Bacteroidales bacterium]
MNYAYIRVSSDKQSVENQKFEVLKYCDKKKIQIDLWIEETESGTKKIASRKIGEVLKRMVSNDLLILSELSRLGRNLMDIMKILHDCMENNIKVHAIKENYELGNNINSKVLAFAFGLSAEIERNLISQRTKEALARKKSEGVKLGRPKGSLSEYTKLSGKEDIIKELLEKKISISAISRILGVHRLTVNSFIKSRKLNI